jgi:Putative transmembrane protein (PGPGW)
VTPPTPPTPRTDPDERRDLLGGERPVERGSRRDRIRSKPGISHAWRAGVFLAGLLCIAAGFALAVLPGPLTIPPVLFGLWIWSTEFEWAHRLFSSFQKKGKEAWEHAKRHPVTSTIGTVGGLALAGVAIWATYHYHLVDRAKEYVGLS